MSDYSVNFNEGGGGAPFSIQLPEGVNIRPFSVYAEWEGTGASGSFHPALRIRSQDGTIVSTTRPEQVFAAGDTGDVTYAPFLHSESEVAPPTGTLVTWRGIETPAFNYYVGLVTLTPGQDPTAITTPQASFIIGPVLSPDETMVAYIRAGSIRVVNTDGTGDTEIWAVTGAGDECNSLDWKKDSTGIVFSTVFGPDQHKLFSIDADGSNLTTIYTDASTRNVAGPSVSPDGTLLGFSVLLSAVSFAIFVAAIDGSGATQIKTSPTSGSIFFFDAPPYSWARTANRFCWSDGPLAAPVWKVCDADGSNTVTIATLGAGDGRPFFHRWSADDVYVYLVSNADTTQVRRAATDGSGVTVLHDGVMGWETQTPYSFGARVYLQFGTTLWSVADDGTDLRDEGPLTADRMELRS